MILTILGVLLVASPFVVLSVLMVRTDGWSMFFTIWGIAILILSAVGGGMFLIAYGGLLQEAIAHVQ